MKPSAQYGSDIGEAGASLPRYASQHVTSGATGHVGHPVYLAQNQSVPSAHHRAYGSSSSPHGAREFHIHRLHAADVPHRSHVPNAASIGIGPGHTPMHMPQRRRTSGHRLSLLWDIGVAGERERDRAESSGGVVHSHSFATTASGSSHLITGPALYGSRPTISMMSSMGGLQPQKNLVGVTGASQPPVGTPPRHSASSGQLSRSSSSASMHPYPSGTTPFMLPGPSSVKTEPGIGAFVKEESKSLLHSLQPHFSLLHSQSYTGHAPQHPGPAAKNDPPDKEVENMPSKESLLQSMDKVDKEINKITSEIKGLERKQQQLENAAKKPPQTEKSTSPKKVETKHKDLWQVIYAENKKKAEAARGLLDHLCQRRDMPLYNQPCDTDVYKENLKKNEEMRPKLLAYFQRRSQLSNIRERYLCARYDQLMSEWQKKTEKIENKRKTKEARVREFFEKQFPEIRKQREQQERFSRSGTRGDACRSEADFNEIVDGLSEQENQEQHMRQLAVVPPMLLDRDERRLKFINNNGLVTDPMEDYKKRQELDHWSSPEKQIFKEKYIQHPKNFHMISSFLEKKSVADCVLFYYLSKKSVGYKLLVRKNSLKPRKMKAGRGHAQTSASSALDLTKTGQHPDKGQGDKDSEQKGESPETIIKEEEIERIDRPPSPRMTRSRNKNLNWTDEDITVVKEGFGRHGKDFAAISRLFSNKTEHQVKNFYNNNKKKHNLDQLILDGKKKKVHEGTRRTRTQAPTPESVNLPATDEYPTPVDEVRRPSSADPQVSTADAPEANKKRKKESEPEKKEVIKLEIIKKGECNSTSNSETDVSASIPRVLSSSTSQIQTRRSTGAVNKGQSIKRNSESPVEEPAEKKPKRSKPSKEPKLEPRDSSTEETGLMEAESMEQESEKTEVAKDDKSPPEMTPASEVTESKPSSQAASQVDEAPATITVVSSVALSEAAKASVAQFAESKALLPEKETAQKAQHFTPPVALGANPRENDGDSSATCSADEEPSMQDVAIEQKTAERKHADSPYAFDDNSSASIKLEASRMPPVSNTTPPVKETPSFTIIQPIAGRPASTHPPQPTSLPPDEKRPQSLPPPPGAIGPANVPISALSFHQAFIPKHGEPRPNSTPTIVPAAPVSFSIKEALNPSWAIRQQQFTGHIVGKVPEENEFRSALQNIYVPPVIPSDQTAAAYSVPKKAPPTDANQTIDLTLPSTSTEKIGGETKGDQPPRQRLPHYHPVAHEATSMQKDFVPHRVDRTTKEDAPISRQRKYTPTEIASMHERAAVIPVSSLRAPMPGSAQINEKHGSEPTGKKEHHPPVEPGLPVKPILIQPGQQPVLVHPTASLARPYLTTSSIPTKFVSGTMTSGAPVRQNQPLKPQGIQAPTEVRRPDVINSGQLIDTTLMRRSPALEIPDARNYPDLLKMGLPGSRTPVVKPVAGVSHPDPQLTDRVPEGLPTKKAAPGSITTGLPIHRGHEDKPEQRTELRSDIIPGRQILVRFPRTSPLPDPTRLQEGDRHPHVLQFPPPGHIIHPPSLPGMPAKLAPAAGSILAGTPVKRKASEESSSSMSPPANRGPYPGAALPRPPTISPPVPKHPDSRPSSGSRRSPVEVGRRREAAAQSGVTSPSHRQTPTASLSQHPLIKQELPGSPHSVEEILRRSQAALPMALLDPRHLAAANQELLRLPSAGLPQLPPHMAGVANPELLELIRQYSPMIPMFLPPAHLYPPGLAPSLSATGSPVAPGSPQNDDSREKMLNQDFLTAQKIMQLRKPAPETVAATLPGFPLSGPPAMTTPGIGVPPLVVSGATPYHPLAPGYHPAGLPVDRLNFIPGHPALPRSPFASQYGQQSGRNSSGSHSPLQIPMKSASPEVLRPRHRSGEMPREFASHQAVKERSPGSPYLSPHGNISPRERIQPPAPQQLSPSHPSQWSAKPFHRLQPSTPPGQSPRHHHVAKPPHVPPSHHQPYMGPESGVLVYRPHESRSSPYLAKHNRTGSLDDAVQPRFERSRPDSTGPRSLPHSPNEAPKQHRDHQPSIRRDSQSPKYHREIKSETQIAPGVSRESKISTAKDERGPMRRESPLMQKHPSERGDGQISQPMLSGGSYKVTPMPQERRDSRSPYLQQRPKEVVQDALRGKIDVKPGPSHSPMQHDPLRMSKNPGEDLKLCGRAKMKAATLIDHIININFDPNHPSKSSNSVDRAQKRQQPQKPATTARMPPGDSGPIRGQDAEQAPKPEPAITGPQIVKDNVSSVTLAKHSEDVINECYRNNPVEKTLIPVSKSAPRPAVAMVTEPISPPEKRSVPSKPETRFQTPKVAAARHPTPVDSRPPVETVRPPVPSSISQVAAAHSSNSPLEDIIRKALLNPESPMASSAESMNPGFHPDPFVGLAMMSTVTPRPKLQTAQGERKEAASSARPQSGSEKYMSALMFRAAPSQNAPQSAAAPSGRQQQFYQSRTAHPASQSPAPQDPTQPRPVLPMPQYEALSDSD